MHNSDLDDLGLTMPKPRGMYNRFRIAEDLALCEEVINLNPFAGGNKNGSWTEIVDNLNAIPINFGDLRQAMTGEEEEVNFHFQHLFLFGLPRTFARGAILFLQYEELWLANGLERLAVTERRKYEELFNKPTDERACKQRVEDLLLQFRTNDVAKLKRSRTEEQYEQLKALLTEIAKAKELCEDLDPPPPPRASMSRGASKRSFPISMAEPDLPQRRHAFLTQMEPKPIAPKPTLVKVVREQRPISPPHHNEIMHELKPQLPHVPVPVSVVKPRNHSSIETDYVTLLIQQNAKQMELRDKELLQARDLREKELDLERSRLQFEDKKWHQHLQQMQQQQDLMREMLQQQQQQQQLIISLLKHQEDGKT